MTREEQVMYADMLLHSGALSEDAIKAIKADFPELAESEDERIRKFLKDYAIEMIAGLESDISISVYDGVKGHDPEAEAELEKWKGARAWLEKQKEQPAEWSEEDEKIMQTMIKEGDLKPSEIAWLKSLRPQPHWKPSEEQMKVLKGAILYENSGESNFEYSGLPLEMLYEDIKKLH